MPTDVTQTTCRSVRIQTSTPMPFCSGIRYSLCTATRSVPRRRSPSRGAIGMKSGTQPQRSIGGCGSRTIRGATSGCGLRAAGPEPTVLSPGATRSSHVPIDCCGAEMTLGRPANEPLVAGLRPCTSIGVCRWPQRRGSRRVGSAARTRWRSPASPEPPGRLPASSPSDGPSTAARCSLHSRQ